MKILVLNSGSSSQKTCLYEIGETLPADPPTCMWEGNIEWDGAEASIAVKNSHGVSERDRVKVSSRAEAVEHLLAIVKRDRKWNDDGARKQLVQLFDAWGPTDPATTEGRKRLSSVLFS